MKQYNGSSLMQVRCSCVPFRSWIWLCASHMPFMCRYQWEVAGSCRTQDAICSLLLYKMAVPRLAVCCSTGDMRAQNDGSAQALDTVLANKIPAPPLEQEHELSLHQNTSTITDSHSTTRMTCPCRHWVIP